MTAFIIVLILSMAAGHNRYEGVQATFCTNCGEPSAPHTVCKHCGTYKGRQIKTVE